MQDAAGYQFLQGGKAMTREDVEDIKISILQISAICSMQKECITCPLHDDEKVCFFMHYNLPPYRWIEKLDFKGWAKDES